LGVSAVVLKNGRTLDAVVLLFQAAMLLLITAILMVRGARLVQDAGREIRRTLTNILGFSEVMLGEEPESPSARREYAEIIRRKKIRLESELNRLSGALPPEAPAGPEGDAESADAEAESRTILVVDDDLDFLRLIEIILGKRNRIITASDGASAISWALDARPDLILIDLFMPRLDGFETVRILQENPDTRKIPVLALSAEMSRVNAERALEAACVGYLGKPFDARTLRRAVTPSGKKSASGSHPRPLSGRPAACGLAHAPRFRQPLGVPVGDLLGHGPGQLLQPGPLSVQRLRQKLPPAVRPGVRPHQEAIRVAQEQLAPIRLQPVVRDVPPKGQLGPKIRVAVQELSDGLRPRRHPRVRPEDADAAPHRRDLRNGRRVHVGMEEEIFPRRQIDDPSEDRGGGVARAHVELPNPPVDAPPGPDAFFEIGRDLRIPKPRGHVRRHPVRAQDRDDDIRRRPVEPERAVVRRAGDEGPDHAAPLQDLQRPGRREPIPGVPAVMDMGIENGKPLGGRRTGGQKGDNRQTGQERDPAGNEPAGPPGPHMEKRGDGLHGLLPEDMRIGPGEMESSDGEAGAAGRRNPLPPLWLRNRPRGLRRLHGC